MAILSSLAAASFKGARDVAEMKLALHQAEEEKYKQQVQEVYGSLNLARATRMSRQPGQRFKG